MSSLVITKQSGNFFSLELDGGVPIISEQNRLTTIGDYCNFKTANGANIILKQNILYSEITIITGVSHVPTSIDDLWVSLIAAGFFDGVVIGGSGTATRFDELLDTFTYFGRDGQLLIVNESELKLDTVAISIFTEEDKLKLDGIESGAQVNVRGDMAQNDPDAPDYIFNKPDPAAAQIPQIMDGICGVTAGFAVGQTDYTLPDGLTCINVRNNDGNYSKTTANNTARTNRWSQTDNILTIYKAPVLNNYLYFELI